MASSIAKNTALMTGASIGQRLIYFAYFTFVARMIGVEGTGKYFLALSFTTLFVIFVDLGVTMLFDSLHLTMYGTLRAIGDLRYEAGSIIGSQFITMVLGTVFLLLH